MNSGLWVRSILRCGSCVRTRNFKAGHDQPFQVELIGNSKVEVMSSAFMWVMKGPATAPPECLQHGCIYFEIPFVEEITHRIEYGCVSGRCLFHHSLVDQHIVDGSAFRDRGIERDPIFTFTTGSGLVTWRGWSRFCVYRDLIGLGAEDITCSR